MIVRRLALVAALLCTGLVVSGCDGSPAPAKSTPLFASEEEAFAAAERTYRAYVDAGNNQRKNASSLPAPEEFLVGQALADAIEAANQLTKAGFSLRGDVRLADFRGESISEGWEIQASACLDVSGTTVIDASGADVTPSDRPGTQSVALTFDEIGGEILVAESSTGVEGTC